MESALHRLGHEGQEQEPLQQFESLLTEALRPLEALLQSNIQKIRRLTKKIDEFHPHSKQPPFPKEPLGVRAVQVRTTCPSLIPDTAEKRRKTICIPGQAH
jgi:hypothetical protein